MNKEILQGKWREMKGKVKEQWGKLTDDDLDKIDGIQCRAGRILSWGSGDGRGAESPPTPQLVFSGSFSAE